ncbi:hypothetical protein HQ590_02230, partial [bacterium]|nr:hypothetical protein [bacterium]
MKRFLMTCLVVLCSLLAAMPSMGEAGGAQRIPGRVAVLAEIVDRSETMYRVQHAEQPPVIDGNIDEWAEVPAMVLDRADQGRRVSGPDDLSGSLRLLWDREALYFCLQVRDNVHSAPNPRAAWDNDCLQFALDPYMNGPGASFNEMERSYCLSDTMGGPVLSSYSVPAAGEVSHDIVAGVTVKTLMRPDGVRVFEMAMPWAKLDPAHPWVLGRLGFTFSLNDNDGEGFKGALVWTEGLLWGKDASKFGVLVFEKAVGTRNAVLELAPELNIFGDRAQSRWITLRDVDPFTSARLLVNRTQPGLVAAALSVYRPGEAEPIATGRVEEPVGAGGTVIFAWDLSGLRDGKYELVFDVPAERPETRRRIAWYKMELG